MSTQPIVPFWNRLPAIARYPLRGGALITLITLSALMLLVGWVPFVSGLLWIAAFKYAFEVLQASANGRLQAPDVVLGADNSVVWRYILLQFLTFAVPIGVGIAVEPALGIALFIAFVLVQPAAIMGLAMTGSLTRALSPDLWFAVIGRVGWAYLALFGLLLVIQFSGANASALLDKVMPSMLADALATVFSLWSLFATFHLMGYLIYQYHRELDFEPSANQQAAARPFNRDQELLDTVSAKVQSGDLGSALQLLRSEIRSRAVGVEGQELYRRLLQQAGDSRELIEHGRSFLHLLMMEKQDKRALSLALECIELDPAFTALELEQNAGLARRASFAGQSRLAINLLLAAIRHPQSHADKPAWALQAADLMTRQSGREAEARALLQQVRAKCDDEALLGKIDTQLAAIPG